MRVLKCIVFIFLIGCSNQPKDNQEKVVDDKEIAIDNDLEKLDFSNRFKSKGNDIPIWVNKSDLKIEDYVESVDVKEITIEGKLFDDLSGENIANNLKLEIDEKLTSENVKIFKSKDGEITAVVQQKKITSIDFRNGADLKLNGEDTFDFTFESYRDMFSGSYSVRNFKPNMSDVSFYYNIDSVETLDFTELYSMNSKLNFTWVNGYLTQVIYTVIEK